MAATYHLTGVRRGNSYERLFRFKDGAGQVVDRKRPAKAALFAVWLFG